MRGENKKQAEGVGNDAEAVELSSRSGEQPGRREGREGRQAGREGEGEGGEQEVEREQEEAVAVAAASASSSSGGHHSSWDSELFSDPGRWVPVFRASLGPSAFPLPLPPSFSLSTSQLPTPNS